MKKLLKLIVQLFRWITSPNKEYQKYYVNNVLKYIDNYIRHNEIITVKIFTKRDYHLFHIFFKDSIFLIKIGKFFFHFEENDHKIFEKIILEPQKIDDIKNAITTNIGYSKIIENISQDFYKNSNYYELFRIDEGDFKRNNDLDFFFEKRFKSKLFEIYENECLFCQKKNNLHVDHFFIPKSKGGNFILKTYNGLLFNNAVLLCETCNKKKHAKSFLEFREKIDFDKLKQRQISMNKVINGLI